MIDFCLWNWRLKEFNVKKKNVPLIKVRFFNDGIFDPILLVIMEKIFFISLFDFQ